MVEPGDTVEVEVDGERVVKTVDTVNYSWNGEGSEAEYTLTFADGTAINVPESDIGPTSSDS